MELREILRRVDHTLLRPDAGWPEIRAACDDALAFGAASVCIPPSFVTRAAAYLDGRLPVCTVIGFPNGYATTAVKCFEAADAVAHGASEVDMVINLGWVKDGRWDDLLRELRAIRACTEGSVLKVIIETCLLTDGEKRRLCQLVGRSGADFIKTSTGFSTGGATVADVALLASCRPAGLKIKAAGGIRSIADAEALLAAGAERLGTSRLVALAKAAREAEA